MAIEVAESSTGGEVARTTPAARSTFGSEVLQLLSSDHPGLILVSSPLDGKNFHAWSKAVRHALGAKSKPGLSPRYGQCNGPLLYQLENGRFLLLDKFLMGLNDEYDNIRSQILVNEPLPSVNMAYSLVLRVEKQRTRVIFLLLCSVLKCSCFEKQRQVHINVIEPPEGVSMHTGVYDRKKDGNNFRRRSAVEKRGLKCEHCNRLRHDKTTCFKLHSVPDWYKELNDQRKKNTTGGKVVFAVNNAERTVQQEEKKEEKAYVLM
ncbi:UNVERIFIED_CONTAM: hypothetical protein Slati_3442700 [Sesamum latifolium]|uniref:Retrotransposon Copia-like N-terminal domain-containing protein n=1 Tax=Sesamum latifolium TaxID=2727402 RepID=A0AAW2UH73_9LAMI